jgi:hypothetical protein
MGSSDLLALRCIEREDKQCDRTRKRWSFVGLELHIFCYPGRCPKLVRLEETSNLRLASECIITDTNMTISPFSSTVLTNHSAPSLEWAFRSRSCSSLVIICSMKLIEILETKLFSREEKLDFWLPRLSIIANDCFRCFQCRIMNSNCFWSYFWFS